MSTRVFASALAAASVAGLALVPAATATAAPGATVVPTKFITKSQVPVTSRYGPWDESPIVSRRGLGSETCQEATLPQKITKVRAVYNDDQGNAIVQSVVRMPTVTAAKRLVAKLSYCGTKAYWSAHPSGADGRTFKTYGRFDIENGLLVRAMRVSHNEGLPTIIHLDAVGRDKRYVMAMRWVFQTEGSAPRSMWVSLSKKALNQLRP